MYKYDEALKILNKSSELSIEDIQDIHNNFIKSATELKNLSTDWIEVEANNYCQYLNAMNSVFRERYKNSEMTAEEYQIWKQSLKEDFSDLPLSVKSKIKKLFMQKVIKIIKNNLTKGKVLKKHVTQENYEDYYIDGIQDIDFKQIKISYKWRIGIMLLFIILIAIVVIFIT